MSQAGLSGTRARGCIILRACGCLRGEHMADQQFEFTAAQNETIQVLSHRMRWVGGFQIISGIGVLVAGIVAFARGHEGYPLLLTAALLLVIGFYTTSASKSFSDIVQTVGADITHLMDAVRTLKSLYNVQFWLVIAYLVIIGLILLAGIFRALMGS